MTTSDLALHPKFDLIKPARRHDQPINNSSSRLSAMVDDIGGCRSGGFRANASRGVANGGWPQECRDPRRIHGSPISLPSTVSVLTLTSRAEEEVRRMRREKPSRQPSRLCRAGHGPTVRLGQHEPNNSWAVPYLDWVKL